MKRAIAVIGATLLTSLSPTTPQAEQSSATFPPPIHDAKPSTKREQTAYLAGGCFWGVEAVFEQLAGVKDVVSGFAGGSKASANSDSVSSKTTGHAEVVKITYDPSKITYGQLLRIFFGVAHDPTQLNRQGPDIGPLYRSSIFFDNTEQKGIAEAYIKQLSGERIFPAPIVTTVVTMEKFYVAGPEHQDYVRKNPNVPYVVVNDLPKLEHLRKAFPDLLKQQSKGR